MAASLLFECLFVCLFLCSNLTIANLRRCRFAPAACVWGFKWPIKVAHKKLNGCVVDDGRTRPYASFPHSAGVLARAAIATSSSVASRGLQWDMGHETAIARSSLYSVVPRLDSYSSISYSFLVELLVVCNKLSFDCMSLQLVDGS